MNNRILSFEVKKNGQARISVDGNIPDLLAGTLTMVKSIYQTILLNDGEAEAEWFLEQMGKALVCPDHPLYKEVRE